MRPTLFALVVLFFSCGARAAVVYEQPANSSGAVIASSFYDPDGMDGDTYVYDDFTLPASHAITEIRWRGGDRFKGLYGAQPVVDFQVRIFSAGLLSTQPDILHPPLMDVNVGGNAGETPAGTFGGIPMYDYRFVLPSPFQAEAGKKYWVQIEAWQHVYPNGWSIAQASPPVPGEIRNNSHFEQITGGTNGGGTLYRVMGYDAAFSLVTADVTSYSIAASASPANAGTVSGAGVYPVNSTVTLTAAPKPGYGFRDWTENGTVVSTSATYLFTASADRTLVANFVPAWTVTTAASPTYGGTTTGGGIYNDGANVTVTAAPAPGFVFADWSEVGSIVSTSASYTFPAGANRDLVADFAPGDRTVVFDLDTGDPPLQARGATTPFSQAVRGVTAAFSSPAPVYQGFSVQSDQSTQYKMALFSGNYLDPRAVDTSPLDIQFSQPVTTLSFTFATADFQQTEIPTTVKVTGYAADGTAVRSASGHGAYIGSTMPMGTLTLTATTPFTKAHIAIPPATGAAAGMLLDNFVVVTSAPLPPLPYTISDLVTAMDICGGGALHTQAEFTRCNVAQAGASAGVVDMLDVVVIARKVAGLDVNP